MENQLSKKFIFEKLSPYYDTYQISQLIQKRSDLSINQIFLTQNIKNISLEMLNQQIQIYKTGEPFEYIINKAEFYGLDFFVDKRVLIPRNDTEIMVDSILSQINKLDGGPVLVDIGTGSSCIPISVLKNSSAIQETYVIDISTDALQVSKINIHSHNLDRIIQQIHGDLFLPLLSKKIENNNIIISANLPYIKDADFENMSPETVEYEPDIALYGGPVTGFELYEKLIWQCQRYKLDFPNTNIYLFIEIGFDQEEYAQSYINNLELSFKKYSDNGGIVRCIGIKI
ncbi:MAG: HemK family protein methyltransferase [Candidatus Gracilibacteria bacterium]|nr:HemK family protein methyltransferase [Candidatus Gracilibacteria bacterium]